jgi:CDP-diacylglycerol--glycerol-3-phosphate 3-phosphatidyltransferase
LTLSRIALAPAIIKFLLDDRRSTDTLAASAIGIAALTDFFDGYVARKQNKVTRLGQFLDPLADKIYISSAFVTLSIKDRMSKWVPTVIIGREALMTLFRIYAGSKGSSVPASMWGKLKTNSQLLALMLVIMGRDNPESVPLQKAAVALALTLTIYSGLDYMKKAEHYLAGAEDK